MLSFPPAVRIWLCVQPTDLRKSFDSLAELVRQHLEANPLSGHVFVFRNRRSDRVKLLYWDEDGFVIVYKRLEEGTFPFPVAAPGHLLDAGSGARGEIREGLVAAVRLHRAVAQLD